MFGSHFKRFATPEALLHLLLVVLSAVFDVLIMGLNNGLSTHLFVLPSAIWLLTSGKSNLLTSLFSTVIVVWLTAQLGLVDLQNNLVAFGLMLIIIVPFIKLFPLCDALSLRNISQLLMGLTVFITIHFLVLNYGLDTLGQFNASEIQLAIIGNLAFGLILVWFFNLTRYLHFVEFKQLGSKALNLLIALLVFTTTLIGLFAFSTDYIRFLAILSILPGLWFCHKHRWVGCAGFIAISNVVLLSFIAQTISQYDHTLPLVSKAYLFDDVASYSDHFAQYSRSALGFTLYEAAWFLCTFNLIGLLVSAMLKELDLAQSKLLIAQTNLTSNNNNLREVNHNIRHVNRFLVNAQENERQQLAKEIDISLHDHMKTIDSAISVIEADCTNAVTAETFSRLKTYSEHIHRSLHEIVHELKPHLLTHDGLWNTLSGDYFREKLALFNIEYSFTDEQQSIPIPDNMSIAIYRIVQEAVNNTIKYANATHFSVSIKMSSEQLNLIIKDDGIGFDQKNKTSGFGIDGMRQRVSALNGTFQIDTRSGTQISITIPLSI